MPVFGGALKALSHERDVLDHFIKRVYRDGEYISPHTTTIDGSQLDGAYKIGAGYTTEKKFYGYIDDFIEDVRSDRIIEMARTGVTTMEI